MLPENHPERFPDFPENARLYHCGEPLQIVSTRLYSRDGVEHVDRTLRCRVCARTGVLNLEWNR